MGSGADVWFHLEVRPHATSYYLNTAAAATTTNNFCCSCFMLVFHVVAHTHTDTGFAVNAKLYKFCTDSALNWWS
jgi:hypothetical protein